MSAAKLSAEQARRLHDADVKVKQLRAALDAAERHSRELRERYRARVPLSTDPTEAAKGVRSAVVGGVSIRISPQVSGDYFSLSAYRAAGHAVTAEMREAITAGKPFDRWTLKPAAGPKKLNAVEPA